MTKPTLLALALLTGIVLASAVCYGVYQDAKERADEPPYSVTIHQGTHSAAPTPSIPPLAARLLQNTIGRAVKVSYLPPIAYRLPGARY